MGQECENCGNEISDRYYRVRYPEDAPVLDCPHCNDSNKVNFQPTIEQ